MALFSLVSERLERTAATGPMLFMLFGLAVSPHGFGIVDLDLDNELALTLAEVTLVLLLFTDASRIDLRVFRGAVGAPLRLLAIALPLIVLGGAAAAVWLFGMGIWEAAALATVLAPTDAALGQAVVTDPRVPARIRQALNVEAGLNDGLNLPLLTIALALAASAGGAAEAADGLLLVGRQIGLGVLIGAAVGLASGWLIDRAASAEWVNTTFQRIAALAVPLFSFALAESAEGNGFIAAFVAGAVMGTLTRHVCRGLFDFGEEEGQLLSLLSFMVFGGAFLGAALDGLTWRVAAYAALSLTVLRMLPVAFSMLGSGLNWRTVGFIGWFGPRGLASIVFALIVLQDEGLGAREHVFEVAVWTVAISVIVHGITSRPGAVWYSRWAERSAAHPGAAEHREVADLPTRRRMREGDLSRGV